MKILVPPPRLVARRCPYCGRKCGQNHVCLVCDPLPAAGPNAPSFWLAVDLLVERAGEASA